MSTEEKKEQEINEPLEKENNKENETTAEAEETQTDEVVEEKDELTKANEEIAELKDKYLRAIAEFDNYKKRTLKEKTELLLNGSEKTITSILPVLDDFERALADNNEDPKAIKEGITLIYNKFVKTLESLGVKKIDTEGKDFDVDYHEAIAMVPGMGDDKKGKVIDCVQTGYQLNDKVIRHAKVAVGE
jgi:molecular chaperone GrpE